MNFLIGLLFFFLLDCGNVFAQPLVTNQGGLPKCPDGNPGSWSSCVGTVDFGGGLKYVGEFKNGRPYDKNNIISKQKQDELTFIETINGDFLNTGYISLYTDYSRFQVNGDRREFPLLIEFLSPMRLDKNYSVGSLESNFSINCNGRKLAALNSKVYFAPKWEGAAVEFFDSDTVSLAKRFNQLPALICANDIQNKVLQANQRKRKSEDQLKIAEQKNQPSVPSPMTILANRRALVIGNDSYKSVAKLANAREDAKTIATNLTTVGYQVTLKLDVTEKEMKAALRTFAGQVQGGDEVLFFFAGHGVQLGATNFLLPIDIVGDSEAQVKDEAIQLQRVLDDMSEKKAKFTLAMVDACRDNPFKNSGRAIGGRGLAATTAATGQMVIFSAGSGQQALDKLNNADKNKNGLFTRVFVQEMQKPNQSIDRVVKNVRNQVAELAKSVGHEQVPAIYDQVLGEFYFYQNASIAPSSDPPQRSQIIPIAENNTEVVFWNSVKDSNSVAEYQAYLTKYPRGMFTEIASSRIERLTKQTTPTVVNNPKEVENKSNQPDLGLIIFKNIMDQILKDK